MLSLDSLLRTPRLDNEYGFDIAPHGRTVCYSSNQTGRWELFELNLTAAADENPRRVSTGSGAKFNPVYSPDSSRIAYALDRDGAENYRLMVYDCAKKESLDLTPAAPVALQPNFSWTPDGKQIALLADIDGCFDAYLLAIQSGRLTRVFSNRHPCWLAKCSPTGEWLAVETEWHASDWSIFLVNLFSGEIRQIGTGGCFKDPCWSADGQSLAFCSDVNGFFQTGVYEMTSGRVKWHLENTGNYESPRFSTDGHRLACTRQRGARVDLVLADHGQEHVLAIGRGTHSHPRFTPSGDALLCLFESSNRPPDLWRINLQDHGVTQLTNSLPPEMEAGWPPSPEELTYTGMDGQPVPALLYRSEKKTAPAVIVIHGGPNWHFQDFWNPFTGYCVQRGWTILAPNYRGSTGYGREWMNAARFDYGGVDTRDVAAGAHWLIREGLADPERIAVTGASHGGYLTMTCMTQFPELWAAGCAVVPFLNWFTGHENSRRDLQHWDIENMGDPIENQALWRERSPIFFLDRMQAPVQLICGGNDPRCPASESLAARDQLVQLGKQVELVLYEDEGHGFLKLETLLDSEQKRIDFLARALENDQGKLGERHAVQNPE